MFRKNSSKILTTSSSSFISFPFLLTTMFSADFILFHLPCFFVSFQRFLTRNRVKYVKSRDHLVTLKVQFCSFVVWWLSLLQNFIIRRLNSGSALVRIMLARCRMFAMVTMSRNSSSRLFSKACPENLQILKVQVRTARTKRSGGLPIIN